MSKGTRLFIDRLQQSGVLKRRNNDWFCHSCNRKTLKQLGFSAANSVLSYKPHIQIYENALTNDRFAPEAVIRT